MLFNVPELLLNNVAFWGLLLMSSSLGRSAFLFTRVSLSTVLGLSFYLLSHSDGSSDDDLNNCGGIVKRRPVISANDTAV